MKVKNLVPNVYYKESRDFSYIGRLFEIIFNYMKSGSNIVDKSLSLDINSIIIDLITTTLGFETKHSYINEDLVRLCSTFTYLLKNKGSFKAIEDSINLLVNSQNIRNVNNKIYFDISEDGSKNLQILIPDELQDVVLLEDIFEYILPAGTLYSISSLSKALDPQYTVTYSSIPDAKVYKIPSALLSKVSKGIDNENNYTTERGITYTGVVYKPESNGGQDNE